MKQLKKQLLALKEKKLEMIECYRTCLINNNLEDAEIILKKIQVTDLDIFKTKEEINIFKKSYNIKEEYYFTPKRPPFHS